MWFLLCVAIAVAFLLHYHLKMRKNLENYPPGPTRLPLLGCMLSVPGDLMHLHAEKWRELYGNVIGLVLGKQTMAIVCGPEECIALLKHEHCQARPNDFFARHRSSADRRQTSGERFYSIKECVLKRRSAALKEAIKTMDLKLANKCDVTLNVLPTSAYFEPNRIMFTDGQYWSEQRRFTTRELRDRGFGKSSLEGVVLDEVKVTVHQMEERGPLVKPNDLFNVPVLNVLWWMVSGKPFSRNDVAFNRLIDAVTRMMRNKKASAVPVNIWPFLRYIAPDWSGYNELFQPILEMTQFLREEVESKLKMGESDNSYISAYLNEVSEGQKPHYSISSLVMNCFDLFIAGGETTANTISFALMYLSLYPEVQAKVHEELDAVIGRDRLPVLDDKPKLQYLEAVTSEVMRINPIAPLTVPHMTSQDIHINGYTIPKDTTVIISMYSILNDKKHWGDPENFRPDRFLNKEGHYVKDPLLLPFGVGKRICLGEPLVHQTLFLFLAGLLSKFRFSVPPGRPKPSTIPAPGLTVAPQPYEILAEKRQ